MDRQQPRVSRETRLLLGIVFISLASLWVLARLRFPDQPRNANPVPPVLAQLVPPSPFDAIASAVSGVESRSAPALVRVTFTPRVADPTAPEVVRLGVRIGGEQAVVVVPARELASGASPPLVGFDSRTRLGLVAAPPASAAPPTPWNTSRAPTPRFVIAAEATRDSVSFAPIFVGGFVPTETPDWSRPVWRLPASTPIADGALLFTDDGLFAGAVVVRAGERTLVPPQVLADLPDAVGGQRAPRTPGVPGIVVQEATPLVAAAIGVDFGLVVAWVDPKGPAAGLLQPLDVIDAVWGQPIVNREQWDAHLEQLDVGSTLDIRVRRSGSEPMEMRLIAAAPPVPRGPAPLGAGFRARRGVGVEVTRIDAGSAAEHAGLRVGDVITAAAGTVAPTPAQLTKLYAETDGERPMAIAVERGTTHLVLALEPAW